MANILFIDDAFFRKNFPLKTNIDVDKLEAVISMEQNTALRDELGEEVYNYFLSNYNTLTPDELAVFQKAQMLLVSMTAKGIESFYSDAEPTTRLENIKILEGKIGFLKIILRRSLAKVESLTELEVDDTINPSESGINNTNSSGVWYPSASRAATTPCAASTPTIPNSDGFYDDYEKTTAERNQMSNIKLGKIIYNSDTLENQIWNGTGWQCQGISHIRAISTDEMIISSDKSNPSYVTGLALDGENRGLELIDDATGIYQNTSGRKIDSAVGTISFHPTETGGGTGLLKILSERSVDGGNTWVLTEFSLRPIEVASNGESFATKVSSIISLLPDEMFRFRLVEAGSGGITIVSTEDEILGQTVVSASVIFTLTEQQTIDVPS